jgi:hypothetical protein
MPLPTLTAEQSNAALEKARQSRQHRAAALDELATGQTSLADPSPPPTATQRSRKPAWPKPSGGSVASAPPRPPA